MRFLSLVCEATIFRSPLTPLRKGGTRVRLNIVCESTIFRSPLTPLRKGGTRVRLNIVGESTIFLSGIQAFHYKTSPSLVPPLLRGARGDQNPVMNEKLRPLFPLSKWAREDQTF